MNSLSDTESFFDGTTVTEVDDVTVPPLPPIQATAPTTNNKQRFRDGNTTRAESCVEKKRKIESGEVQVHPFGRNFLRRC